MKKYVMLCSALVCLCNTPLYGGARGHELKEMLPRETVQRSPSPNFLKRVTSYFAKSEPKKVQKKTSSQLVHEKMKLLQDLLKELQHDGQKRAKLERALFLAKDETQKSQLQEASQKLKQELTTQKIPAFINEFTQFYITLAPHFRASNDIQAFAKNTLEQINIVGKQLEGKYWQPYALLTEHELKRAQHRYILDMVFNKQFSQIMQDAQVLYTTAVGAKRNGSNVFSTIQSDAYENIMKVMDDVASLDAVEFSADSYSGILYFKAYLSALLGEVLVTVFDTLPAQTHELASMSAGDKEEFLRDLKIALKQTIKNSVKYQDELDDMMREDLRKSVEAMRERVREHLPSAYADMIARNKEAVLYDAQLEKQVSDFDNALRDGMRNLGNAELLRENREKITTVLNAFLATAKIADPSNVELVFISKIQHSLLKLITAISRRGKEVKYGSPISKNLGKELLQTLMMAYAYCARLSLMRVQVRNMLCFVVGERFIVMPYMKKDEARALLHQEKKPHDSASAMRLSIMRLPLEVPSGEPVVPHMDDTVFPFATWLMKGFKKEK